MFNPAAITYVYHKRNKHISGIQRNTMLAVYVSGGWRQRVNKSAGRKEEKRCSGFLRVLDTNVGKIRYEAPTVRLIDGSRLISSVLHGSPFHAIPLPNLFHKYEHPISSLSLTFFMNYAPQPRSILKTRPIDSSP